ncbi:MAG: M48 family metallopeptidase [Candidatus Altiarchaeales archaeon]|nr:M48 family metallopeptidase [Candidatus Altiarchaeales archaeon]
MNVKIIRSGKRKKTISAREVNGIIQLYLPMGISREEEFKYVQWAKRRFESRQRKKELRKKNANKELEKLARKLNKEYLGGELSWKEIRYSTEQNGNMFGNCNTRNKTIRISDRLLQMPKFVHDYVLMHELAHLRVPKHGSEFWKLVNRYPKTERARGYLMAIGMGD